jgi:hypothetical protein
MNLPRHGIFVPGCDDPVLLSWIATMDFASASPSVVRSVRQLDLLNAWLRAFAGRKALPHITDFHPDRVEDELADMVAFDVIGEGDQARFLITREGARLRSAYGHRVVEPHRQTHRFLDDAVGPARYARLVALYRACLAARRPVYSISMVRDADGKEVSYERLLLPFGNATAIDHIVGSYKAVSIEGGFKIEDLMSLNPEEVVIVVRAVIDRDVVRSKPGLRIADDLEFS